MTADSELAPTRRYEEAANDAGPSGKDRTVSFAVALRDARPPEAPAQPRPDGERLISATPPSAIPVLDLFAGAGGLSDGLRDAGFAPLAAIELMQEAAKTYREAHDIEVIESRVGDADLASFRGKVQVVVGGPPCQPWSTGGLRRGSKDERDGFPEFLKALRLIEPDAFLIENVAGLASSTAEGYRVALIAALKELGYHVKWDVLDAASYGVPQRRRRVFIVGMRKAGFQFPTPTHGPGMKAPWVSSGSVLKAEPVGEPNPSVVTYAKKPHLRPSAYDGLLFNGGGRPLDLSAPARTILASAGGNKTQFIDTQGVVPGYHSTLWERFKKHGHDGLAAVLRVGVVSGARRLTVAESAALQTFDPGKVFYGKRSTQYTLVGNAVPPKLASAVGRALAHALAET